MITKEVIQQIREAAKDTRSDIGMYEVPITIELRLPLILYAEELANDEDIFEAVAAELYQSANVLADIYIGLDEWDAFDGAIEVRLDTNAKGINSNENEETA